MLNEIKELIINGRAKVIADKVQAALDAGNDASDILAVMVEAMGEVGELFTAGEYFVPEMLVSAKAMKKGVAVLKPHLQSGEIGALGKCVIGTVQGDLHDIGKNLVAMLLESAGFEVIDLGVDVAPEAFVEAVNANPETKIVGLSTLLTTTMPAMESTVALLNAQAFRDNIKIMVGGAPITQEFAAKIGADAYTEDAGSAVAEAKKLAC